MEPMEPQEEALFCQLCGEGLDEVYHELACTSCGKNAVHGDCVEKYLKRINLPGSQLSGYGCFCLKQGEIRKLDHETHNHAVLTLSGFLFDGGADKDWSQKPFARDGREKRYFCSGAIEWTRKDVGRKKKKAKAPPVQAPAPAKFSKQVQQQTAAAARRLLEVKMMGQPKKAVTGAATSSGAGSTSPEDDPSSWITVGGNNKVIKQSMAKDNHTNTMISNDASVNNKNNTQVQKKQAPAVVAPGSGAAARMGANLNGKRAENQTLIPGMEEPEQSVAFLKKKTKSKVNDANKPPNEAPVPAPGDLAGRPTNAMDGKEGFVSSVDRYNALIGSPMSPLSPDDSIPDAEDDSKSVSEISSIQSAAPFDFSSLTDAQLAHAIAYGVESLSDFIPAEAIAFVEAVLSKLRNDLPDKMNLIMQGFEEEEEKLLVADVVQAHINKAMPLYPPAPVPMVDLAPLQNPVVVVPQMAWPTQQHFVPQSQPQSLQTQVQVQKPVVVKTYDLQMLQSLISMGFSKNRSAHALIATDNSSIDAAMDFILAFENDPSMDEPVATPSLSLRPEPPPSSVSAPRAPVPQATWGTPQNLMPPHQQQQQPFVPVPVGQPYQHMIFQAQQQLAMPEPYQGMQAPKYGQPIPPLDAVNPIAPVAIVARSQDEDDELADLLALCGV